MDFRYLYAGIASAERARNGIRRSGIVCGHRVWLEEEVALLSRHHPDMRVLISALHPRTYKSIKQKAVKVGIARKYHCWTSAERLLLRKLYARAPREEILAHFPGIRWRSISDRAQTWGFKRLPNEYKSTGFPLLDLVRQRCRDLGYSMGDLDEMAHTGFYFRKSHWRSQKSPEIQIAKAVACLGGKLQIHWDE